jgi:hypothetical protein
MEGVIESKNGINMGGIHFNNRMPNSNIRAAQNAYKRGLNYHTTGITLNENSVKNKLLSRAHEAGLEALKNNIEVSKLKNIENGLKRMGRWDPNDPVVVERKQIENRIIADGKVKYWEDTIKKRANLQRYNGRNRWVKNQLERSKQVQSTLTQKKGWFSGGKHRKTHKRPNHNKCNKTKRNRN